MPAHEVRFSSSTPPANLYVDTDVLVAAVVSSHVHHRRARPLFVMLARHGATTLYLSPLTRVEYLHVFGKEAFRRALPPSLDYLHAVDRWEERSVRDAYFAFVAETLEGMLSPFMWIEVPLSPTVQAGAIGYMGQYNLGAQDAVHLASARLAGVRELASFDRGFRRVDDLVLWNDRIFERR